ncbi:MAG: hypothetical protein M3Z22_04765 [Verrucomicrobiota bacterium]|nr:hypothetical protein [Verrucomicrobiota bacterium]
MTDEFTNRFTMFQTALGVLNSADYQSVWSGQPPLVFTDKVATTGQAVVALENFCIEQGVDIHGAALAKEIQQTSLENDAHILSRALVNYLRDKGNETDAQKVNLKLYQWRGLRDEKLTETATVVRNLANDAVTNDKALADTYGITNAKVTALDAELAIWGEIVTKPAQAVSKKKGLGTLLRSKFNDVSLMLHALDDLILQFDATQPGRNMIAAFKAGRIVRDLGHGPKKTPPAKPTP